MNGEAPAAEHFPDFARQEAAATLGMWLFLATEILLFGGLFLVYTIYRVAHPGVFAEASGHLQVLPGAINTIVLLTSSLFMAFAVQAAESRSLTLMRVSLAVTIALGCIFLAIKGYEYHHELQAGLMPVLDLPFRYGGPHPEVARLFFGLYVLMTGLHALHLIIGILIVATVGWKVRRLPNPRLDGERLRITGLYWHLVDVIWLFIFPLLYLIERNG